ncbi:oxygen-independent coproporphyrinogen III oxidase [Wenzhouxiangella marina]|uniref:Coproporphyrinogen-III oxidase n=1 Tax=Wenzhouxiangella marina TaxID=1579979 RepID=A0A0K0XZL0_9GAMM|nr:oxygen-independent coproporphyrinogen III oxidase [Wenzhouxiangella marina]AKS43119.1 coproporphyrinogen III oxidase [Wenzhouxiangella marina]MBB6087196.1 oxygen-independent coproporphyrinogen-3 oxidase [Wenzhouxiangella marina]
MSQLMRPSFDQRLIDRYGGEGPRYTSYPTAVHFTPDFGAEDYIQALAESNRLPIPADLSLYVHVPFCANPCFYCGCNRVITRSVTAGDRFLASLEKEIALIAPRIDSDRRVRQLHLGGGTPTFLNHDQLSYLTEMLRRNFSFASDAEMGLEIDPRTIDPQGIRLLREAGYNRISIGVQDLEGDVQQAVNRIHDTSMVAAVFGAARAVGFESISLDLIYGLPLQTTAGFARTIDTVIGLRPDRLSLFNYAHLPHLFKAQQRINEEQLPTPKTKLAIFRNALTRLLDAGYEFIGMDHFALPGDSLVKAHQNGSMVRNFQGYSTHGGLDLVALGPSAISQVGDSFAQNERKLDDWAIALEEGRLPVARGLTRTTDDRLRAEIIERIMCTGRLVYRDLERLFELKFRRYFAEELARLEPLAEDGLIEWTEGGFEVTPAGLLFLRAIAKHFDAYLNPASDQGGRFSRIV